MPRIVFTANLSRHVACPEIEVAGDTLRVVLDNYFAAHPQARRYILDDQGAVQRHVNIFVEDHPTPDRLTLSETVEPDTTIYIFQALSGG